MANIYTLQGAHDSGKTSSLIQLFSDIKTNYPNAQIETLHNNGAMDIKVILRNINGKTIAIGSHGDKLEHLKENVDGFLAAKCDIIFCACRSKGATLTYIQSLSVFHSVKFVSKSRALVNFGVANSATSTLLMQLAGL
jgi:hypothetical protein